MNIPRFFLALNHKPGTRLESHHTTIHGNPGGQFNSFVEISTDFSTEFLGSHVWWYDKIRDMCQAYD